MGSASRQVEIRCQSTNRDEQRGVKLEFRHICSTKAIATWRGFSSLLFYFERARFGKTRMSKKTYPSSNVRYSFEPLDRRLEDLVRTDAAQTFDRFEIG